MEPAQVKTIKMLHFWAPSLGRKYLTKMEVVYPDKRSSLLRYGIYYSPKSFIFSALVETFIIQQMNWAESLNLFQL
jgi:hypothetical protein